VSKYNKDTNQFILPFKANISNISLPEKFTFPFYYEPHELCKIACDELQDYLTNQQDFTHNFGLHPDQEGMVIGKMFGVLVVKTCEGNLGYLAAVSGKLAGTNNHKKFVPPVYDLLQSDSFFLEEEKEINALNDKIDTLEKSGKLQSLEQSLKQTEEKAFKKIDLAKQEYKKLKAERKLIRNKKKDQLSIEDFAMLEKELQQQSIHSHFILKDITKAENAKVDYELNKLNAFKNEVRELKQKRKHKSGTLQSKIFEQYSFLNEDREEKNLLEIFESTALKIPPAGAGECSAPKLLQHAFLHNLTPICMAEFWWGQSPKSEIRQHKNFYPACKGKCEPILGHMLSKTSMDPDPMKQNHSEGKNLEIIHEDDTIVIINKPEEFLSVPGRHITDSAEERLKQSYPENEGPILVHRLDMSTSGIMVGAKNPKAHRNLQIQFTKRYVKKRYVAVLDGILSQEKGEIRLPLMLDYADRPRQKVCYKEGKASHTSWEKVSETNGKTRVNFYPHTGRTHQLRVHAAHLDGLNTPILGDDLYGKREKRLYLHAEEIEFNHPKTGERVQFIAKAKF